MGLSFTDDMFRTSAKSKQCIALRRKTEVPAGAFTSGEAEYSVATPALLTLVSIWAAKHNTREGSSEQRLQAKKLIGLFLSRAVRALEYDIILESGHRVVIQGGKLQLQDWRAQYTSLSRSPSFKPEMDLVDACLALVAPHCCKEMKATDKMLDETRICFISIVEFVALLIEYSDEGAGDDWSQVPILRSATGRSRRVAPSKKIDMRSVAAAVPGIHSASQVVAIDNALKRKRGQSDIGCSIRASKRFTRDHMWQYMLTGRAAFDKVAHVNLTCDGLRVDGDELTNYLFNSPEKAFNVWGPPQVHVPPQNATRLSFAKFVGRRHVVPKWEHVLPTVSGDVFGLSF